MKLRDFAHPIARRIFAHTTVSPAPMPTRYATYGEALSHCTERGYENADIVNVVLKKTIRLRDKLQNAQGIQLNSPSELSLGVVYGLAARASEIRVLDFGGACGAHYFLARAILPVSCQLRWVVVETTEMAKAASVLANDELSFSSSLTDAAASLKPVDLLHTSGTLQHVDNPDAWLHVLVSIGASHMLFNRLGLTRGNHDVITTHTSWLSENGPGEFHSLGIPNRQVSYPFTFLRESLFLNVLGLHYDVVATFADTSGIFPVADEPIAGSGLLARHKAPGRIRGPASGGSR
jgi:putative methyltransferase (TIGR04325 family)